MDDQNTTAAEAEQIKQDFLTIGRGLVAKELAPLRDLATRTMDQKLHATATAFEAGSMAVLGHILNALHPFGVDRAVVIASDAAAAAAQAVAGATDISNAAVASEAVIAGAGAVVADLAPAAEAGAEPASPPALGSAPTTVTDSAPSPSSASPTASRDPTTSTLQQSSSDESQGELPLEAPPVDPSSAAAGTPLPSDAS